MVMIKRKCLIIIEEMLKNFSAVGLLGPRQIGKTTLAHQISNKYPALYLDFEDHRDLAKLQDTIPYLEAHSDKLIILDEIQRKPEIFMSLRSVIDQNRRAGKRFGQFLILGSASIDLLKQSSESLAGRISYFEMNPITILEVPKSIKNNQLWLRGGFPDSLLASSPASSVKWRQEFIKTYLERDIPQFGPRIPAETLRRLWIMLAHNQATILNIARLAGSLGVSGQTVSRYIDLLTDLFLIRKLQPWQSNVGKRLIRSPKTYIRDSGILHSLLNIDDFESLLSHPVAGASFEGFVIDNILSFLPAGSQSFFYRSANGAEIDLIVNHRDGRVIAIEIKLSSSPTLSKGFHEACKEVNPSHRYVVYSGSEKFSLKNDVYAISLLELIKEIGQIK